MSNGPDISGTELLTGGPIPALVRRPQPLSSSSAGAHPALIMLHGRGANEGDIYELVQFVDKRVLVVAPRAPGLHSDDPRGSFKWFEWTTYGVIDPGLSDTSLDQLGRLLEGLDSLTGVAVDPGQIYVGGFSQGAVMTLRLAATLPEQVAGVLPHSGYLSQDDSARYEAGVYRGRPAWVAHGNLDNMIAVEQGRRIQAVLHSGGVEVTYQEYPIAHSSSLASRQSLADWLHRRLKF